MTIELLQSPSCRRYSEGIAIKEPVRTRVREFQKTNEEITLLKLLLSTDITSGRVTKNGTETNQGGANDQLYIYIYICILQ